MTISEVSGIHPEVHAAIEPVRRPVMTALLDFVCPRRCLSCGVDLYDRDTHHMCAECWANVEPIGSRKCPRCAAPMGPHAEDGECLSCRGQALHFHGATAFGHYAGPLRDLVHRFKYNRCSFLGRPLGRVLSRQVGREPFAASLEVVAPVSLHWRRWMERGFNQSELLAAQVARDLRLPLMRRALVRTRFTQPQAQLGAIARRRNIEAAFAVRTPRRIKGRTVLLIDDVMTTCSTLAECAKAMRAAGARRVYAAVVAR